MRNEISRKKYKFVGHAHDVNKIRATVPKVILKCSAIGCFSAIVLSVMLGIIAAVILYQTGDPARYVTPVAFSVLYISALTGGFFASKLNGRSALLCGILSGTMILAFIILTSLLVNDHSNADYGVIELVLLYGAVIVCAIIGAFIGTTRKNSKYKKRKNRKKR